MDATSEGDRNSAEWAFADAFTSHYNDIGASFPEFLRLRELTKIQAMYLQAGQLVTHL